jgi:hypothetical protein
MKRMTAVIQLTLDVPDGAKPDGAFADALHKYNPINNITWSHHSEWSEVRPPRTTSANPDAYDQYPLPFYIIEEGDDWRIFDRSHHLVAIVPAQGNNLTEWLAEMLRSSVNQWTAPNYMTIRELESYFKKACQFWEWADYSFADWEAITGSVSLAGWVDMYHCLSVLDGKERLEVARTLFRAWYDGEGFAPEPDDLWESFFGCMGEEPLNSLEVKEVVPISELRQALRSLNDADNVAEGQHLAEGCWYRWEQRI